MKKIMCWDCGKPATKARLLLNPFGSYEDLSKSKKEISGHQRCYCDECFEKHNRKIAEEHEEWLRLKRSRLFENAIDKLERQNIDFTEYKEAIKTVEEYNLTNPDKFDSASEIIAAIILIHNHIHIKPQYKIEKYQVDFLLPDDKVVLEIDGVTHKLKTAKDAVRDDFIRYTLGKEWQVVRIPAEELNKNATKLIKGIEAILDYRYSRAETHQLYGSIHRAIKNNQ